MAVELSEVVSVSVNVSSTGVQATPLGVPLAVGRDTIKSGGTALAVNTTRSYTSLTGLAADWVTSTQTYKAGAALLGQNPRVRSIKVARIAAADTLQVQRITFSADFVTSNSIAFLIEGVTTTVPFNTSNAQTYTDIDTALTARADISNVAVNAGAHTVDITTHAEVIDGGLTITSAIVTLGSSQATATITETTPANDLTTALTAIEATDSAWYGLVVTDRDEFNVQRVGAWVTGRVKLAVVQHGDDSVYDDSITTDAVSVLQDAAYDNLLALFHDTDGDALDGALLGRKLALNPDTGTTTWNLTSVTLSQTADVLTAAQSTVIRSKGGNTYEDIGGTYRVRPGQCVSGRFADTEITVHWVQIRIQEAIYAELAGASDRNSKIPYTDPGFEIIRKAIAKVMALGERVGHFVQGSSDVTVPALADISTSDKAARLLTGVRAIATLAGAIHTVEVTVDVSI